MKSSEIGQQACPQCGYVVELASGLLNDATPTAGDLCVCLKCGAAQVFDDRLALRLASPDDIDALAPDQRAMLVKAAQIIRSKRHMPS